MLPRMLWCRGTRHNFLVWYAPNFQEPEYIRIDGYEAHVTQEERDQHEAVACALTPWRAPQG